MARITKEVVDVRSELERQSAVSRYLCDDLPDVPVSRGPLTTVQGVVALNSQCEDSKMG